MEQIQNYFGPYDINIARQALSQRNPPSPIYTLPEGRSWALVTLDTIFTGVNLFFIYSFASFCLRKITESSLPKMPSPTWKIVSVCALPYAFRFLQSLIASLPIHTISHPLSASGDFLEHSRENFADNRMQSMRFSVKAKGNTIDGVMLKNPNVNLDSRWIVVSGGNIMLYENHSTTFNELATQLNANVILYNYPGAGRSSGLLPSKEVMIASHRAILGFLEEVVKAKEIVDFGYSLGGGVMGQDHLEQPRTKEETKYVSIFYKTFTSIEDFGKQDLGAFGKWAVKALDWNYNPLEAVNQAKHGVIVVQSTLARDRVIPEAIELKRHCLESIKVIDSSSGDNTFPSGDELNSIAKEVDILFNGVRNNIKAAKSR